jgi:hypothetical protein
MPVLWGASGEPYRTLSGTLQFDDALFVVYSTPETSAEAVGARGSPFRRWGLRPWPVRNPSLQGLAACVRDHSRPGARWPCRLLAQCAAGSSREILRLRSRFDAAMDSLVSHSSACLVCSLDISSGEKRIVDNSQQSQARSASTFGSRRHSSCIKLIAYASGTQENCLLEVAFLSLTQTGCASNAARWKLDA